LVVAILILVVGYAASGWVSRWLSRGLVRIDLEPPVRSLLARTAWVLTFALFIVMALQNLGVELLPLIAGLGVLGAGVALATQGVLSNVVAGLSIIFTKPFRVGEYISIAAEEGRVESITLFSTTLGHPDRSRIVIPNRKIAGEILHNYGTIRQLEVAVGVAYDTDLAAAFALIREVLQANPRVLHDPPAVIQTTALGEWSIILGVRPWVAVPDRGPASSEINTALLETFRARGIVMPVPLREVKLLDRDGGK
jgi:small conductance mechanosensitive channel